MPTVAHAIATTVHGRYCVRASQGEPVGLIVGFHGYAQTAEVLAGELDRIPGSERWLAVSVQGLHRFYTRTGDVVASWMTSQDRELAIDDNIAFVRAVVADVRAAHPALTRAGRRPAFLGFSQGAAMAFRAAAAHGDDCAGVVALGGDIPPDIRQKTTRLPPVLIGRGAEDQWYTAAKLETDRAWLASTNTDVTIVEHAGGHEWTDAFRTEAGRFLAGLA